jgi:hypothetical protein
MYIISELCGSGQAAWLGSVRVQHGVGADVTVAYRSRGARRDLGLMRLAKASQRQSFSSSQLCDRVP